MQLQTRSITSAIPVLQNGDHLTQAEFERRYEAMPQVKKAELIEGVVYMPSPVRVRHAYPHGLIAVWLGTYQAATPGLQMMIEPSVRLDQDNEPQPDIILRIAEGGSSRISADDYIEGSPELVVEIAASTVSIDLNSKLNAYRRNGIQEYLVWQVEEPKIDWFSLVAGQYKPMMSDTKGRIRSQGFPGLWLSVSALLGSDLPEVLATVQQGIQTSDHADFVNKLSQR